MLYPGWRLILPDGATPPASPELARDVDHVVEPGDTLWDIAEDHLGSGERYPEVFDLNDGVVQPDGQRLTDPDLIRVGWELDLPEGERGEPIANRRGCRARGRAPGGERSHRGARHA